jgi:flagellar biosynthesis protein FliP
MSEINFRSFCCFFFLIIENEVATISIAKTIIIIKSFVISKPFIEVMLMVLMEGLFGIKKVEIIGRERKNYR